MSEDFSGQVALVTGAAAGIGLATAVAFGKAGASVVLADLDEQDVQKAADTVRQAGGKALGIACDVRDEQQVKAMVERAVAEFGQIDMAFNNAGVMTKHVETADADGAEFDRVIGINLRGMWSCLKYELIQMRKQGAGAIVNCSSMGGEAGGPGLAAYHASKHGIMGMTKSAALEYADKGIRINAVLPGVIDTPMNDRMTKDNPGLIDKILKTVPIARLGKPEEIASAVLFLCGPGASLIIGHGLAVDGGFLAH